MNASKSGNDSPKGREKLRNFDLTVDEIRILKAITDLTQSLEDIESKDAQPVRLQFFLDEIKKLEERLEEIRDNTLIR